MLYKLHIFKNLIIIVIYKQKLHLLQLKEVSNRNIIRYKINFTFDEEEELNFLEILGVNELYSFSFNFSIQNQILKKK